MRMDPAFPALPLTVLLRPKERNQVPLAQIQAEGSLS